MSVLVSSMFGSIESSDFCPDLPLASDVESVGRLLRRNRLVKLLISVAQMDAANAELVSERVQALLRAPADSSHLSPYDTALATYLLVLYDSNLPELTKALGAVYEVQPPNLWWTYRVYNHLLPLMSGDATLVSSTVLGDECGIRTEPTARLLPVERPRVDGSTNHRSSVVL